MDIILTCIMATILLLSATYEIKECIRRRRYKKAGHYLEANHDIKGVLICEGCILALFIICTCLYYFKVFINQVVSQYIIICCLLGIFNIILLLMTYNKIIIDTDTGTITAYQWLFRKRCNVKDITLLKHGKVDIWKAYVDKKLLFRIADKYYSYPNSFYIYIRNLSECKEQHPKGYTNNDI